MSSRTAVDAQLNIYQSLTGVASARLAKRPDEDEGSHNLYKDDGDEEHRPACEIRFGTRNGGREERQIREVPDGDDGEQHAAAAVDPPAEPPVEQFDDERGQGGGGVESESQLRR